MTVLIGGTGASAYDMPVLSNFETALPIVNRTGLEPTPSTVLQSIYFLVDLPQIPRYSVHGRLSFKP